MLPKTIREGWGPIVFHDPLLKQARSALNQYEIQIVQKKPLKNRPVSAKIRASRMMNIKQKQKPTMDRDRVSLNFGSVQGIGNHWV